MASRLFEAAEGGNIETVKGLYNENRNNLGSCFLRYDTKSHNFLYVAAKEGHYTFLFEVLGMLSSHPMLVIQLMSQFNGEDNPLHGAVENGSIFILRLLVNAYTKAVSAVGSDQKTLPWLEKVSFGYTPLHLSLMNKTATRSATENIARYLVSVDEHFYMALGQSRYPSMNHQCSTQMTDMYENSIVFVAMYSGFSQLVKQILTSRLPYALSGQDDQTPLHYAYRCNEQVSRLLLEKHPELIMKVSLSGKTMLDHAIEDGATWLVKLMLTEEENTAKCSIPYQPRVAWTRACRRLIWHVYKNGDTLLHIAARKGDIEILQLVIQGYNSSFQDESEYCHGEDTCLPEPGNDRVGANLFHIENNTENDIPLVVALRKKDDDCALILSMETFPLRLGTSLAHIYKKSFPIAIDNGCLLSAKKILERVILSRRLGGLSYRLTQLGIHSPVVLQIAEHMTRKNTGTEAMVETEEFEKFLQVFARFLGENQKDSKMILKEAVERGEEWFVRLVLESDINGDLLEECIPAWQVACENGYEPILRIFVELCDRQKFIDLCKEKKQTPLHHINRLQFEQYVELLKMPVLEELKNETDSDGATPLHRAIQRHDLELTKALLQTDGIEIIIEIKDRQGLTAVHLLEKSSILSPSWFKQCIDLLKKPELNLLNRRDDEDGTTPLHRAIERDDLQLSKALLQTDGIEISIEDKKGTTAFQLLEKSCKLSTSWLEEYIELIKKRPELKLLNQRDKDGTTPLHRAIQRDDLQLTKALLEVEGIDVNINDNNRITALDLLQKSCTSSPTWGNMCRGIKQESTIKQFKYLFRKISFEGMQNTMSVVAALVVTITFAAGFAVPGGPDSRDGAPVLAKKAAFLAFSVSNTIAMCCSVMVLFLLLGPMMWDPHPSLFYVNMSLFLLLTSLGGTVVAFMTGVYATMAHQVKWEAMFVIVLCSVALFMACIVLLLTYWSHSRDLFRKPYDWLKTITRNTTTQTAQQPAGSSNLNAEIGQSSGTTPPTTLEDIKIIEIKQSRVN